MRMEDAQPIAWFDIVAVEQLLAGCTSTSRLYHVSMAGTRLNREIRGGGVWSIEVANHLRGAASGCSFK